jgi:6,7-dimethyl-8-ribityllumazine synthase
MPRTVEGALDAKGMRVALVASRANEVVTSRLVAGAVDCLERHGASPDATEIVRVPGSWELALVARKLASSGRYDAVIVLGCLIRGETPHFDFLAGEVARGLMETNLQTGVPVVFGVLTTDNLEQALDRAGAKGGNRGFEAALAAIEMVALLRRLG